MKTTRKRDRNTLILILLCWALLCLACKDGPEFSDQQTPPTPMAELPPTNTFRMVRQPNGKTVPVVTNEQGQEVVAGEGGEQ